MALSHSPQISLNGLVLCLDAANPKSYPGSGTTWTDLSGNGNNATYNGSPIIYTDNNLGSLETPASQTSRWIRMPETALQNLTDGTIWTLEWTMKILSHSGTRYCQSMARSGNDNVMIWQINASTMQLFSASLQSGSNPNYQIGTPISLSLTRNGNSWVVYKDGIFAAQYSFAGNSQTTVTGWVLDQEQDAVLGGFDSNQNTHAEWYSNRMYNRALTAQEIQQNFNATKSRYI